MRAIVPSLLAMVSLFSTYADAHAADIRVPLDYPTIWEACDAATAGDRVLVEPGTWTDRITRTILVEGVPTVFTSCGFLKEGIQVIGVEGALATTVSVGTTGEGTVSAFVLVGVTEETIVEDFTLTGGGGTAYLNHANLSLHDLRVVQNTGTNVDGRHSSLELLNCLFAENDGCGVNIFQTGLLRVIDCTFERNKNVNIGVDVGGNGPTGLLQVDIKDSVFRNNSGFSVSLYEACFTIVNNLFLENQCEPSALYLNGRWCGGEVAFNVFAKDSTDSDFNAGGLTVFGGSIDLHHNTFYRCFSAGNSPTSASSVRFGSDIDTSVYQINNVYAESEGAPAIFMGGDFCGICDLFWGNDGDYVPDKWCEPDIVADPLFCDAEALDFTVQEGSPCAPGNTPGCDAIGAEGVGCEPTSVEVKSWGKIKGLYR